MHPASPLEPHPIAAHLAPPERRLPFLLSCVVYAALASLGTRLALREPAAAVPVPASRSERIYVIDLARLQLEPPKPEPATRERDPSAAAGTGTIDAQLLKFDAVAPTTQDWKVPDQLPTELPTQANPAFLGTKHLPVAAGGDGRPKGTAGRDAGRPGGPSGSGPTTLSADDLDFVNYVKPEYPRAAIAARVEGIVWVRVTVSEDGLPLDEKPLSGPAQLVPATLKAVKEWRFGSLRRRGIRGPATVDVSVLFLLVNA